MPVSRYKLALLNWLSVYPMLTLVLWVSRPWTRELPLYVNTLIISLILTVALSFVVMPWLTRRLQTWLTSGPVGPHDADH